MTQPHTHLRIRRIERLTPDVLDGIAMVTADAVASGASVGFMHPFSTDDARHWWRGLAGAVESGERILFVAEDSSGIVGTVSLVPASMPNQPHRADIAKMLVHRSARRQGIGAELMRAAEAVALDLGKTILVLDTASDDAERLYTRLGWQRVGVVPDFALLPGGGFCDTIFFYRRLA